MTEADITALEQAIDTQQVPIYPHAPIRRMLRRWLSKKAYQRVNNAYFDAHRGTGTLRTAQPGMWVAHRPLQAGLSTTYLWLCYDANNRCINVSRTDIETCYLLILDSADLD